jgi:hypothetical protein
MQWIKSIEQIEVGDILRIVLRPGDSFSDTINIEEIGFSWKNPGIFALLSGLDRKAYELMDADPEKGRVELKRHRDEVKDWGLFVTAINYSISTIKCDLIEILNSGKSILTRNLFQVIPDEIRRQSGSTSWMILNGNVFVEKIVDLKCIERFKQVWRHKESPDITIIDLDPHQFIWRSMIDKSSDWQPH